MTPEEMKEIKDYIKHWSEHVGGFIMSTIWIAVGVIVKDGVYSAMGALMMLFTILLAAHRNLR